MKLKPPIQLRIATVPFVLIIVIGPGALIIWFTIGFISSAEEYSTFEQIRFLVGILFMGVCYIAFLHFYKKELHEKLFAQLIISKEDVKLKCILRKTIVLSAKDIHYCGVAVEDSWDHIERPKIYVSINPLPNQYRHKINKLPCCGGFIQFWYSTTLIDALKANLPAHVTAPLDYYQWTVSHKR